MGKLRASHEQLTSCCRRVVTERLYDDMFGRIGGQGPAREGTKVKFDDVRKVFELLVRMHPGYAAFRERDGWGWARRAAGRAVTSGSPTGRTNAPGP